MFELFPDGTLFGMVDNGIVLVGMYLGVDIEGWLAKKLGKKSNPLLGAVVGATSFNAVSDGCAAILDPATQGMSFGIVMGCLSIMVLIPVIETVRSKRNKNKK